MNIIETKNLTKVFDNNSAVKKLNLKIPKGEISGLLGPNGSGKTTTLRLLLGLAKPSDGNIEIFGLNLFKKKSTILNKVGALIDSPAFYEHLTAYDNLRIMQLTHNIPKERIDEVLKIVELHNDANKKVKDFSLGMKQRLGIAIALINDPELLILDEPTNGLDPSGIIKMRNLLSSLSHDKGITIIISNHNLYEIEQMCNYVCLIQNGDLLYQGEINSLFEEYSSNELCIKTNNNKLAAELIDEHDNHLTDEKLLMNVNYKEVPNIVNRLVENDLLVYEVMYEKETLEDIFLQLTNNKE